MVANQSDTTQNSESTMAKAFNDFLYCLSVYRDRHSVYIQRFALHLFRHIHSLAIFEREWITLKKERSQGERINIQGMMLAEISMILPVYNGKQSIHKSITSIISQTFNRIALKVIDDGSIDYTPSICDEHALLDFRVTVIHKENGGVEEARQSGIELIDTDYIGFIDADDECHPRMIEKMIQCAKKEHADVVMCDHQRKRFEFCDYSNTFEKTDALSMSSQEYNKLFLNGRFWKATNLDHGDAVFLWNKIYLTSLFKKVIPAPSEDTEINLLICNEANRIYFLPLSLYVYSITQDSLSKRISAWCVREYARFFRMHSYVSSINTDMYPEFVRYLFQKIVYFRYRLYKTEYWPELKTLVDENEVKKILQSYMIFSRDTSCRKIYKIAQFFYPPLYKISILRNSV